MSPHGYFFKSYLFSILRGAFAKGARTSSSQSSTAWLNRPRLETLEGRAVPATGLFVAGSVFADANANGLRDTNETGLAGVSMELRSQKGVTVSSVVTDSQGNYRFDQETNTIVSPFQSSQTLLFDNLKGAWSGAASLQPFNPSLGSLTQVEVRLKGQVASTVRFENLDTDPASPRLGLNSNLLLLGPTGTVQASAPTELYTSVLAAYDGISDFSGTSGVSYTQRVTPATSNSTIATPASLASWTGTTPLSLRAASRGISSQEGSGNLTSSVVSQGKLEVEVIYSYLPSRNLLPGTYTIVEPVQPIGWLDGLESINGSPIGGTIGTDSVGITLGSAGISGVNFAEVRAASIQGVSYIDQAGDGKLTVGDPGASGSAVTLTGTTDQGFAITAQAVIGNDGRFQFLSLRPGSYTLSSSLINKNINAGTQAGNLGGQSAPGVVTAIQVRPGNTGVDYLFGQVSAGGISGTVYNDLNGNNQQDSGELGLPGQTVSLSGNGTMGSTQTTAVTDSMGDYLFGNLLPGTYALANPSGLWVAESAHAGQLGGVVASSLEQITQVVLNSGAVGENYLFGKVAKSSISGTVYIDANKNGLRDPNEPGLAGVTLQLNGNNNLGQIVSLNTISGAGGAYTFSPLRMGSYTITQVVPAGYTAASAKVGTLGGLTLSTTALSVSLNAHQDGMEYDFGVQVVVTKIYQPTSKRSLLGSSRR